MKKRVVITGLGAITPIGNDVESFWNALIEGKSGIGPITHFDVSNYATRIAGEVKNFDATQFIDKKEARRMDRCTQFAVAAAGMAIKDAKLDLEAEDRTRIGTYVGTGIGGVGTFHDQLKVLYDRGPNKVSPFFIPMMIANMPAGHVSITYGLQGPSLCIITACATGTNSIGEAFRLLQSGDADVMIAGGAEAAITPAAVAGFCSMKAMSTRNDEPEKASRPFDKDRDGFIMGEGAGILILETLEHAQARGATIYAEMVGYGANADAYHMTAPAPEGVMAAQCMSLALKNAGLKIEEVDYVNAHGTSTPMNDKNESLAIVSLFGEHAKEMKVSSNKSMIGHLLGASGGVEAVATVMTIKEGIVPATMNLEETDIELGLDYVPNAAVKADIDVALSNSFGFGGHNATIAIRKFVK